MSEQHDQEHLTRSKQGKPKNSETMLAVTYFTQIGITISAAVFIGVVGGKYLDELLGTTPWMLLIFSFFGVGAAFRSVFQMPKGKK